MEPPLQAEIRGQPLDEKLRTEEFQLQIFISSTYICMIIAPACADVRQSESIYTMEVLFS